MHSKFLGSIIFNKKKVESLKRLRIINQNLVHIEGLPKNLLKIEILKSTKYFGQYGKIKDVILSRKINPENNKVIFSVYITYENKLEAACAILCADSLLVDGKIIRAFYGTTKYCNYFLNNTKCKNKGKCMFLHQLVTNDAIIIDANSNFSYNDHLNMSRKIMEQNKLGIKNIILKKPKNSNNILPSIDFIFLDEEQKEKYFRPGNICYIKSSDNTIFDTSPKNNHTIINIYNINNLKLEINNNNNKFNNNGLNQTGFIYTANITKYQDSFELYNLFKDSIKHILLSKPFFSKIKNASLKRLELNYLRNDLLKKGIDINVVLAGCLDCVNDFI